MGPLSRTWVRKLIKYVTYRTLKKKKKHEMGEQNSKAQVYCMRYTEFR